jgi:pimeloyl-ACP methyl ester carboxylesterase
MRWVWWGVGIVVGYLVLAPVITVGALWAMLTVGIVPWSKSGPGLPVDPLTIGYRGDPKAAFGWEFETVRYPTELGDAEAWVVPGEPGEKLWAIWVHGIGGLRENGYRMMKTLHEAGLPVLMITYRNDEGAPRAADALYSFGMSEWPDLEAAVNYAVSRGAKRVAIAAESMGAAITGQYLMHAGNTERIAGLAFDAPALDFPAVIHAGGKRYWVPLSDYVAGAGLELWRYVRRDLRPAVSLFAIAQFPAPVFLAHGSRDPLVPFSISEALVAKRPDITFWKTEADRHPMSFEEDRAGYAAALANWVEAVKGQS